MLPQMRPLPARPAVGAVHRHISPAPPSLGLGQHGRVAVGRMTTAKTPLVCCSVANPAANQGAATMQRPWKLSDARLVLEDGSVWNAKSFGATGTQVGEVVFNTSMTGYQEILTDPSYAGQFVLMTCPHIGNTGVNLDDEESIKCFLGGLIVRNLSISTSNWRSIETLDEYLRKRNIMGIYDVDTRAITRRLREDGSLIGVLSTDQSRKDQELLEMAKNWKIVVFGEFVELMKNNRL